MVQLKRQEELTCRIQDKLKEAAQRANEEADNVKDVILPTDRWSTHSGLEPDRFRYWGEGVSWNGQGLRPTRIAATFLASPIPTLTGWYGRPFNISNWCNVVTKS